MAEGRVLTHKILMILLFCSDTFALRAQEKNYESHWYWRAGVTASRAVQMATSCVFISSEITNILDNSLVFITLYIGINTWSQSSISNTDSRGTITL